MNGLAAAPPKIGCINGVSTSKNPLLSSILLIPEIIFVLFTNVSLTSLFIIRSTYLFLYLVSTDWFIDKRLYSLENTYSVVSETDLARGDIYVLLGGGIITTTGEGNIPGLIPSVRIMKTAEYYKKYPKKILISGGTPLQNQESESSVYSKELIALGVASEDIIIEEESRNTNENALFTKKVLDEKGAKNLILITSASHMKRSVNIFKKKLNGVEIIPAPCNFLASREKENNFYYLPKYSNFFKFQTWIWETIGNLYYKIKY